MHNFILASASPRRQHLLNLLGIRYTIQPAQIQESHGRDHLAPIAYARKNALLKAKTIAERQPDAIVLGVDTIGAVHNQILEKPQSTKDAVKMLTMLSGKTHTVYSGVALVHHRSNTTLQAMCRTKVTFRTLSKKEIKRYVATGEPMDKAAAYAIQGGAAVFIKKIEGDYTNIIGLPVTLFLKIYAKMNKKIIQKKTRNKKGTGCILKIDYEK